MKEQENYEQALKKFEQEKKDLESRKKAFLRKSRQGEQEQGQ